MIEATADSVFAAIGDLEDHIRTSRTMASVVMVLFEYGSLQGSLERGQCIGASHVAGHILDRLVQLEEQFDHLHDLARELKSLSRN
jgi:hypothetical protein